jgi:hypothetical protein
MPASAAAAIAAELVIEGGKNPIIPFLVIVKPFDEHFPLRGEPVVSGNSDILIDLLKTILTKTVKISL